MKKIVKAAALLIAAMAAMGLVSCADNDAEDLGTLLIVKDYQEKKEAEAAAAAAAAVAKKAAEEDSTPVTVDAKWDFVSGANASKNTKLAALDGKTGLTENLEITADSGSGATFTLLPATDSKGACNKPKYNSGIQQNTGTDKAWEFASVKVEAGCTISVVARAAGDYSKTSNGTTTINLRTFYFEGEESSGYKMTSTETKVTSEGKQVWGDHTVTYKASAAGTYKILASGMKFISVTCSQ